MKRPALFLLVPLLAAAPLLAQDDPQGAPDEVLKNATFSDGTTYWHGDCKPAGSVLTITYQVSPDFKLSDHLTDYVKCGPNVGFGGANIPSEMGKILAFIDVPPLSRSSVAGTGRGQHADHDL